MDNRREKIIVSLGIFLVLKIIIVSIMAVQITVIYQHSVAIMMVTFLLFGNKERMVWKFDQPSGYVSQYLLGLYTARMFQDRLQVSSLHSHIYVTCLDPF